MKFTKTVIAAIMLSASVLAHADGIEWSGFGSLYYSQAMDKNFLVGQNTDNKPDYTSHSLVGFNVGSVLSPDMTFNAQLVMAGAGAASTNFNMFAQWAYISYKPSESVTLKIGRQLWPMLISSEYQRVHYLLPQTSISETVYGLSPFVSFDGVSANKKFNLRRKMSLTIGAFAGAPKLNRTNPTGSEFSFPKIIGARATLDGSGWRLHGTINKYQAKMQIDVASVQAFPGMGNVVFGTIPFVNTADITLMSAGYRYDKHNIVSWGEMFTLKGTNNESVAMTTMLNMMSGKGPSPYKFYERSYGGYLLLGYRIEDFLPSVTVAQGTAGFGFPSDMVTNQHYDGKVTSIILCNAYKMNDQASLKVEFQRSSVKAPGEGFFDVAQSATSTKKYGDIVKAGVDFIF